MKNRFNIQEIARKIEWELNTWPGNCYAVSCRIIERKLVKGRAVYGHYYGPVSLDNQYFRNIRPFQRHGWITTQKEVIDFTRWVFEEKEPYVYIALFNEEYDEGGNRLRRITRRPTPAFSREEKQVDLKMKSRTKYFVLDNLLGGSPGITFEQARWIANLDLQTLSNHASEIYTALKNANLKAAIPIDNWKAVMQD